MEKYFNEGYVAFAHYGLSHSENPYSDIVEGYEAWSLGWHAAKTDVMNTVDWGTSDE